MITEQVYYPRFKHKMDVLATKVKDAKKRRNIQLSQAIANEIFNANYDELYTLIKFEEIFL